MYCNVGDVYPIYRVALSASLSRDKPLRRTPLQLSPLSLSPADAKPVPIKVGPAAAAAAAAAAARHEVQVNQLEDQLAGHQRDLATLRSLL